MLNNSRSLILLWYVKICPCASMSHIDTWVNICLGEGQQSNLESGRPPIWSERNCRSVKLAILRLWGLSHISTGSVSENNQVFSLTACRTNTWLIEGWADLLCPAQTPWRGDLNLAFLHQAVHERFIYLWNVLRSCEYIHCSIQVILQL